VIVLTSPTTGFGVLARVRSSSSLAVSMAVGVHRLRRPDSEAANDDDDNDSDSDAGSAGAQQWVMPSLLSVTRSAPAQWPAIGTTRDAVLVARWRRVWAFDALAAPAGMTSRLIVETMQFDARVSVLAIWRTGVEVVLPCGASRYDDDDNARGAHHHRFAAALVYDRTSNDNTLSLDVCCWRTPAASSALHSVVALDTPQSLLMRLTQIIERALLDISDMSEPVQRVVV
jgi:hypothetical protein